MNCKPGDLAVIVAGEPKKNIGCIVKVTRLNDFASFLFNQPMWFIEGDLFGERADGVADDCLRPLRDPGEDAQDETLLWKPVPLPEIA